MPDPALALLVFFALVLACATIVWPTRGIAARLRRIARLSERVRMEDVLKQLYKLEYDRLPATAESVAGGVQISRHQAIRLLQRLEEKKLVHRGDRPLPASPHRAGPRRCISYARTGSGSGSWPTAPPRPPRTGTGRRKRANTSSRPHRRTTLQPRWATPSTTRTVTRSRPRRERCRPGPAFRYCRWNRASAA